MATAPAFVDRDNKRFRHVGHYFLFLTLEAILSRRDMGAVQSAAGMDGVSRRPYNNQEAVSALLLHHHRLATTRNGSSAPAKCPVPHGPRGAMARDTELNPLNKMPSLSQERAPNQTMPLSRERVVSSIPRAATSAAPGDSPYGPAQCPVPHDVQPGAKLDSDQPAKCPVAHGPSKDETPGYWEYPSPQQFYNALVRKGWETPEENVEMMVLIHNFLNERAWQEILDWEKLAGSDLAQLQLARFQGRPGTLTPRARIFGILGWMMPSRFRCVLLTCIITPALSRPLTGMIGLCVVRQARHTPMVKRSAILSTITPTRMAMTLMRRAFVWMCAPLLTRSQLRVCAGKRRCKSTKAVSFLHRFMEKLTLVHLRQAKMRKHPSGRKAANVASDRVVSKKRFGVACVATNCHVALTMAKIFHPACHQGQKTIAYAALWWRMLTSALCAM